jgi:hypothetical protein
MMVVYMFSEDMMDHTKAIFTDSISKQTLGRKLKKHQIILGQEKDIGLQLVFIMIVCISMEDMMDQSN